MVYGLTPERDDDAIATDDADGRERALAEAIGRAVLDVLKREAGSLPREWSRVLTAIASEALPEPRRFEREVARASRSLKPIDDALLSAPALPPEPVAAELPLIPIKHTDARATLWNRYERGEHLWRRGDVDTWLARERDGGRAVVIDVLPTMQPAQREAWLAQARRLARSAHPGVARVLAQGELDGQCHLVAEATVGEPLSALLARGQTVGYADALKLMGQAAQALSHAHDAIGHAHGDLRPERVVVAYPARGADAARDGERAVIGGFLLPPPLWHETPCVVAPPYVAPERHASPIGATVAGDIYALGAMLHHLLAGRAPAPGDASDAAMAKAPTEVRALIATALAADPACRFLSYRGFAVACEKALHAIAPEASTVRILRKPMPKRDRVVDAPIAPELVADEVVEPQPPRKQRAPEALSVITTRILRKHRHSAKRLTITRHRFEGSVSLLRRPMPKASAPKAAATPLPANDEERMAAITRRIARKHGGLPPQAADEVRERLRALRRKLLARPRRLPSLSFAPGDEPMPGAATLLVYTVLALAVSLAGGAAVGGAVYVALDALLA